MTINRKLAAISAVALLAGAAPIAAYATDAATDAATVHTGTLHVWVTPGTGAVDKILLTGVIGDYGRATSMDKNGTVDANGAYVKIALKHGGFEVNAVAFNKAANSSQPHVNRANCSVWETVTGNVTLFKGHGAYAGITGKIKISTSFAGIVPRFTSGPDKGKCNLGDNVAPRAEFDGPITGSGRVSF